MWENTQVKLSSSIAESCSSCAIACRHKRWRTTHSCLFVCVCVCCVVCVVCVCVCVCVLYLFLDTGFTLFFCGFNKVVYFFETHSRRFHVPVKCVSNMCKALASMCGLQVRTCFSFCLCYICTHGRGVLASLCGLQTRTFLVCVCIQECKQTHGESACDHVQAAKTKLICLFACGERERERESLYVCVWGRERARAREWVIVCVNLWRTYQCTGMNESFSEKLFSVGENALLRSI